MLGQEKRPKGGMCICRTYNNVVLLVSGQKKGRSHPTKGFSFHTGVYSVARGWLLGNLSNGVLRSNLRFCMIPPVTVQETVEGQARDSCNRE